MSSPTAPWWTGVLAGPAAAATGLALGTGTAAVLTGVPSPITSVGNRVIVWTPQTLKEWAIEQFGTSDKLVLISTVLVVLTGLAALAGWVGLRRPGVALAVTAGLGLVAVAAAAVDQTATAPRFLVLLPSVLTTIVAMGVLALFLRSLDLAGRAGDDLPGRFDRRGFLRVAFGAGAVIALGGAVTRIVGGQAAAEARRSVTLPSPASTAGPVPAGAAVDVAGVSPYLTPNPDFYRIDTALQVPQVPIDGYTLRIHGLVEDEITLSFGDLLRERLLERRITLTCVSNEVGGPYVGNAAWLGVPVRDLLERAGVASDADAVKSTSADGMTIGTPLAALTDPDRDALLAVGMNGEPLPLIHGFPVRMVTPGLYGYVSATKWLVDLEVTRFADFTAYWTDRGYAAEAPIKLSSRIDVPRSFQSFAPDAVRVGGVAWAQHTGIETVEVRVDDGPWNDADLGDADTTDTWRQWAWTWPDATGGPHSVTVRATDRDGRTQTSDRAPIAPDGSTGWHTVQFRVE